MQINFETSNYTCTVVAMENFQVHFCSPLNGWWLDGKCMLNTQQPMVNAHDQQTMFASWLNGKLKQKCGQTHSRVLDSSKVADSGTRVNGNGRTRNTTSSRHHTQTLFGSLLCLKRACTHSKLQWTNEPSNFFPPVSWTDKYSNARKLSSS